MIWNNLKNPIVNRLHVTEPHLTQQIQWVGLERLKREAAVTKSLLLFRRSGPEPGTRTRTRTRNQEPEPGTRNQNQGSQLHLLPRQRHLWLDLLVRWHPSVRLLHRSFALFLLLHLLLLLLLGRLLSLRAAVSSLLLPSLLLFLLLLVLSDGGLVSLLMLLWSPVLTQTGWTQKNKSNWGWQRGR